MSIECECIELNLSNPTEQFGHFIFTSLEEGESATLATMLRRTLLTSLPGLKIIGFRISDANNEFSNVQGVREDLLEIVLNLKEIVFQNWANETSCYGRLKVQGPAIVTAGCLELPNDVKVLNPQSPLLTVTEETFIELEVKMERGKNYALATDRKPVGPGDFLAIDANFTPVLRVNSHIHPILEEVENSHEEVHLMIYTDGSLLPHQALKMAGNKLASMILSVTEPGVFDKELDNNMDNMINEEEDRIFEEDDQENMMIEDLEDLQKTMINESNMIFEDADKINEQIQDDEDDELERILNKINEQIQAPLDRSLSNLGYGNEDNSMINKNKIKDVKIKKTQTKKRKNKVEEIQKNEDSEIINPAEAKLRQKLEQMETGKLEDLGLSNRINNILKKANINYIRDLLQCSLAELKKN
uniref:RNA polymerase alpha subunit n=1 Tax=Microzonia abyssicola TaxID=217214 RepID=UPI002E771B4E|nr:RNA polymerase alpha subunit [Syringoderma abyssicola]WAM64965.1 RNA polymerase alpha subunit [Syringoderma abyssicola]